MTVLRAVTVSFILTSLRAALVKTTNQPQYVAVDTKVCIKPEYAQSYQEANELRCSLTCTLNANCKAFQWSNDVCTIYSYQKAVHKPNSVKICTGEEVKMFRKRSSFCPTDFKYEFFGSVYKLLADVKRNFHDARAACESLGPLVRLADIQDLEEGTHAKIPYNNASVSGDVFVNGAQEPGSAEPSGGWLWQDSKEPIEASLWWDGEPNNSNGNEHYAKFVVTFGGDKMFIDEPATEALWALCECSQVFP